MLRVEIGSCLEESVASRSVGPQSNLMECLAICKKEKKKEGLSREAGQVGQPGKGEVLLAPSGFLYLVWLLDRLPEPGTLMLLSFISNSSYSDPHSGETSHLLSSWGDYLWKENATRPGWSARQF